jgi:hypothetical protein
MNLPPVVVELSTLVIMFIWLWILLTPPKDQ